MNDYLAERFYRPLGLATMGYNPSERFSKRRITPTENDQKWRKQIVQGSVHDMGAAMLGGVGGHAGLFSNANDLGVVMQMLLNGGTYGGRQYFQPATIQNFTAQQKNGSRRGLGFDKPEINPHWSNPASSKASPRTFGHTGFTGTCVWADPDHNLVFVFLSNRTYPQMNNNKLQSLKVRTRIQDVVYEAIDKRIK
ncbi:MAG: serine hydrolase [Sphingobacteriales bacterium]|nr:serine hydrolase [Sphingobacteriales bacterium]